MDVLYGAMQLGIGTISAYAFSTENWRRSPDEVRFLMGFNKDVIRRRRDELAELGVRIRWAGRRPRLWRSVISQLEDAEQLHPRQRPADAAVLRQLRRPGRDRRRRPRDRPRGRRPAGSNPAKIDEQTDRARTWTSRTCPTSTCSSGPPGEQRTSNFLLWQSAYAELMFLDTPWPDFDRRHLWAACLSYARRDRRFGAAGPVDSGQTR